VSEGNSNSTVGTEREPQDGHLQKSIEKTWNTVPLRLIISFWLLVNKSKEQIISFFYLYMIIISTSTCLKFYNQQLSSRYTQILLHRPRHLVTSRFGHLVKKPHCLCAKWRVITTPTEKLQWILAWVRWKQICGLKLWKLHAKDTYLSKIITTLGIFPVNVSRTVKILCSMTGGIPTVQLSIFRSEVCFIPEDGSSMFVRNTDTNTLLLSSSSPWVRRRVASFYSANL